MNRVDRFFEVVGVLAIVLALYYRQEIAWAVRNRATIQEAADVASAWDSLKGALS